MLVAVTLLYLRLDTLREKLKQKKVKKSDVMLRKTLSGGALELHKSMTKHANIGVVSVREKVIQELRDVQIRVGQDAEDDIALEYCIKMISSNQLNEQDFDFHDGSEFSEDSESEASVYSGRNGEKTVAKSNFDLKTSMKAWYAQFAEKSSVGFKHNSVVFNSEVSQAKTIVTKLGSQLAKKMVTRLLDLNPEAQAELQKIDHYNFDIFKLRKYTDGNELVTILPILLAKHGLFASCNIEFEHLMSFVRQLAVGYKQITYHNQTHAADVCATFNYFVTDGGMKEKIKMDNLE